MYNGQKYSRKIFYNGITEYYADSEMQDIVVNLNVNLHFSSRNLSSVSIPARMLLQSPLGCLLLLSMSKII